MSHRVERDWARREQELLAALEEAAEQRERAEAQSAVLERITTGAPLREVLDVLVRTIEARCDGMLGSVLLVDSDGKHLKHGSGPSLPDSYTSQADGLEIGPAQGSCGTAAHEGRQVVVEDVATDPLWDVAREVALSHGLAACWSTRSWCSGSRTRCAPRGEMARGGRSRRASASP